MTEFHTLIKRLDDNFHIRLIGQLPEVASSAEPLEDVIDRARARKFDTAFIGRRRSDAASWWIDQVVDAKQGTHRAVAPGDLVSGDTPLSSAIKLLATRPFALVLTGDRVTAVVTRADLNLMPVRIMLFTMLTQAEMLLTEAILAKYSGDTWCDCLPVAQQEKIRTLQQEKRQLDADTRLIDCASLGQKCELAERTPALRSTLGYSSKASLREERNKFVRLRNRLFHNQDIVPAEDARPEDVLRDALAHGDPIIVSATETSVRALLSVVEILHRWIDRLAST